jgi:hypothetical protein
MASISWPTTCAAETQERRRNLYARARGGHVRFWRRYGSPPFIDDPLFRSALPPERLAVLRTTKHAEQAADPMRSTHRRMFETDKRTVKKLLDADVRLGFGTDSGGEPNRFFLQGWFEHRQMELLRDAGLAPMQIIQTFSKNNSEILGIDKDFGTLAKGKAADLLVQTDAAQPLRLAYKKLDACVCASARDRLVSLGWHASVLRS